MGVGRVLNAGRTKQMSIVSLVVEAGIALARGRRKLAVALLGAAAIASRWTGAGFALELLVRLYQWRR